MFADSFQLDAERLSKLAKAYAGYANALRDADSRDIRIKRASSFVIAASYFALIDLDKAHTCFWEASHEYSMLQNPFAFTLAVCSTKPEGVEGLNRLTEQLDEKSPIKSSIDPFFYQLPYRFWLTESLKDAPKLKIWPVLGIERQPVGRLGLPIMLYEEVYTSALSSALSYSKSENTGLIASVTNLLKRVAEITHTAMQDKYHWRSLNSTVLPVEPEILATMLSVTLFNRRHDKAPLFTKDSSFVRQLDPIASSYVNIASHMLGIRD